MTCMFIVTHTCSQMYLKTLEKSVLKYMNLILLMLICTRIAWKACLKKTGVKLTLLIDIDMLLMLVKGICHAIYVKANNKYVKNYDKKIISSYLM